MKHISKYDKFVNEMKSHKPKSARLRSAKAIIKQMKLAGNYTGYFYDRMKWIGRDAIRNGSISKDAQIMFTDGSMPWTDKGRDKLIDRMEDRISELIDIDPELAKMHQEYLDEQRAEKEAREKAEEDEKRAAQEAKVKKFEARLEKLNKELPGAKEFYTYNKMRQWYTRRNPWSSPKISIPELPMVPVENMEVGKYYVVDRATIGNTGLLTNSIIQYVGNGKVKVIFEAGMYGSSSWYNFIENPKATPIKHCVGGMEAKEFLKTMKSEIKKVSKELEKDIVQYKARNGDKAPEWDPMWGMN